MFVYQSCEFVRSFSNFSNEYSNFRSFVSPLLITDSKAVFGWLRQIFENVCRVRVGDLHKMLIERHSQVATDLIETGRLKVRVE